jgi:transposase
MNHPWTPESAAYAAKLYEAGHSINSIAEALDRTERSIIAKFTQLGLYRSAPKPAREPTKAELVGELCHRLGMDPTKTYTLTAASHEALVHLLQATAR